MFTFMGIWLFTKKWKFIDAYIFWFHDNIINLYDDIWQSCVENPLPNIHDACDEHNIENIYNHKLY